MRRFLNAVRSWRDRWGRDQRGSVFIEAGMVIAFLGVLGLFVWDVGSLFLRQTQITNAVRAGSQYALVKRPVGGDLTPVIEAILNAAPKGIEPSVDAELYCLCNGGEAMSCDLNCSSGIEKQYFLSVEYTDLHQLTFRYPGAPRSITLSDSMRVRLR